MNNSRNAYYGGRREWFASDVRVVESYDINSAYPESFTEREPMEITEEAVPTQAEYNTMIEKSATSFYTLLGKAGFDKDTLTDLALSRKNDVPWEKVPVKVRLCIVRLWMAIIPKPEGMKKDVVAKKAEKPEEVKVDEVIPPKHEQTTESADPGND